ncbi:MAG: hypothetical protein JOZ52_11010, partial [Acidobacteria bacterium]|nr:hypothetical protein [Acidobacteriota bacterium]
RLPTIQFSQRQYSINKSDYASAWVTVERRGDTSQEVSVECSTFDASALAGVDYVAFSQVLSFAPKETRKRVSLTMVDGRLTDDVKIVNLVLSNFNNAAPGQPVTAELLITQRDNIMSLFVNPMTQRLFKHILLVCMLLALMYGSTEIFIRTAESHARGWAVYLTNKQSQMTFPADTPISAAEQARLQDQLERVRQRMRLYLEVMKFFYTRYYMAILTFAIAGALAAITLVLVSKRGWEATNEYILTAFFVMTACTVFYGAFPGVFQQEQNIKENKVLYLKYEALENEILSYAVTNESRVVPPDSLASLPDGKLQDTTVAAKQFIHYVDEQLAQGNIAVGFDYNKVPNYKNAFDVQQ